MRTLAVAALLIVLALAGCTSNDGDGDATTSTSTSSSRSTTTASGSSSATSSSTSTSSAPPAPANTAPTGSISASINGTRVAFNLTGIDADGDALSWTLTFGDGNATSGASLPAQVNHTYLAGNYSAVYNVTDGTDSVSYNVNLAIVAAASGTSVVITGSTLGPGNPTTSLLFGANGCAGFNVGENGVDCVFGELASSLAGHAFAFTSTAAAPDYELWDACDPVMGVPVQEFGGPATGTVPAGVGCVIMWNYGDGTGSFTFTVS